MPDTDKPKIKDPNVERDFEPGARAFVWTVWTAAFVAVMIYASFYTTNIPWADEWSHTSVIAGERPLSITWLWEQHNEHRVLLPKLIWLLSLRFSQYNFRLLPFLDILALTGLAFAMVLGAKNLRGGIAYTDAFFPLLILNPAQYENLLWAWQVGFILPVILTGVLLLLIIRNPKGGMLSTWKHAVLACACLVLLPFCAAVGLAFGAVLSLWFDYLAFSYWRSAEGSDRRKARLFLGGGLFVLVATFFYLSGLRRPADIPPSPGVRASLITSLELLCGTFGMHTGTFGWPVLGLAVLFLISTGLIASLLAWRRSGYKDSCAAGLFMLLTATVGLVLAIGRGRSGLGELVGMAPRYVTLMIPGLCGIYFTWQIYTCQPLRRFLQVLLFTISYVVLPVNVREALTFGRTHVAQMKAFEKDLRAGSRPWLLAEQHKPFLNAPPELTTTSMPILHRAGIGLFRYLKDSGPIFRVAFPLTPVAANAMEWHDGIITASGQSSYIAFTLSQPEFVSAIRLKYAYISPSRGPLEVFCKRSGQNGFVEAHTHFELGSDRANQALTVLVDDTIDEFRIHPDKTPCEFRLFGLELVLLDRVAGAPLPDYFGGSLDVADQQQIVGWVRDKQRSNTPIQVDLYDGHGRMATVLAGSFRQDLVEAHIGGGKHGFTHPVSVKDGKVHIVRALVYGTKVELPGSPKAFLATRSAVAGNRPEIEMNAVSAPKSPDARASHAIAPSRMPLPDNIEGNLDLAESHQIAGWAWDKNRPDIPILVDIREGETLLKTISASLFRRDLLDAHKGKGAHGFSYEPGFDFRNGSVHQIRVFISGTNMEISGSPKTVTINR